MSPLQHFQNTYNLTDEETLLLHHADETHLPYLNTLTRHELETQYPHVYHVDHILTTYIKTTSLPTLIRKPFNAENSHTLLHSWITNPDHLHTELLKIFNPTSNA
jgi:hypothetical protein